MNNKKTSDYLEKITSSYFSNLINKMTITPIAINANPTRFHIPNVDINSDVKVISPTRPTDIFNIQDTNDIKIKPIMKVTTLNPSIIFFLFILSSSKLQYYMKIIKIFGGFS